MKSEVAAAIQGVRDAFPGHQVEVVDEPQGGAMVIVHDLSIGDQYVPAHSWCGFTVSFQYPEASPYPHYICGTVKRIDKKSLGEGLTAGHTCHGRPAIQVSRRSNRWDPAVDTAAIKLQRVLDWIRSHTGGS